jgi:hypothetical protein
MRCFGWKRTLDVFFPAKKAQNERWEVVGTPVVNKQPMTQPLKVFLADERQVMSTHMCDIHIKGIPFVLTGHIIPDLSIASLFGTRVLTKAE